MLKKAILLFPILCMLVIIVSCGGNPIIPPGDEEGNIQITDMFWDSNTKIIEIAFDPFPSIWGNWTMYIDGEKLPMEGGPGNPVIRPNASLDELPTGLLVGTLPWVSSLTEVDFPCCGTIQFDIPDEGLTNEYEFNLANFGCETASEEECSQTPIPYGGTYRFLCVGVGEYINYGSEVDFGDSPPYELVYRVLSKWKFGSEKVGFSRIDYISDFEATKSNILQGISSTFSEADDDDVSYFYFGGHGGKDGSIYYICPADMTTSVSSKITVNELEEALSAIPGTKVVIIDSCYSGGFIGKNEDGDEFSDKALKIFNEGIIKIFSSGQNRERDLLTADCYKVLASCSYNQISNTINFGDNIIGAFTAALLEGCGYNYFPADSDSNGKITLEEAYLYVKDKISSWGNLYLNQDVQVYPTNSTFIFAEY